MIFRFLNQYKGADSIAPYGRLNLHWYVPGFYQIELLKIMRQFVKEIVFVFP